MGRRSRPGRRVVSSISLAAQRGAALATVAALAALTTPAALGATPSACDPLDPAECLQPFPNDFFTVADRTTATGRRLAIPRAAMPTNKGGRPIDPTDIDRFDGFSPGNLIVTKVPGLDNPQAFAADRARPDHRHGPRLRPPPAGRADRRGDRQAAAHLGRARQPRRQSPTDVNLILRPGRNLREGHRFIVALRGLRDADRHGSSGSPGPPSVSTATRSSATRRRSRPAARTWRTSSPASAGRACARDDLYLAWDFTVASRRSLSSRVP